MRTSVGLVHNAAFNPGTFDRGRPKHVEICWYLVKMVFFLTAFPWPSGLQAALLRLFGAKVGTGLILRPRVNIHSPWKLVIGNDCWIGERTEILNLESVTFGDDVALAHDVYMAAAGHDIASASRPTRTGRSQSEPPPGLRLAPSWDQVSA